MHVIQNQPLKACVRVRVCVSYLLELGRPSN